MGHSNVGNTYDMFYNACREGDLDCIRTILFETPGLDVRAYDEVGLHWAARQGHLHIVKFFVEECNSDMHADNGSAFFFAAQNGHLDVVKYWVEEHQASVHSEDEVVLRCAAREKSENTVEYLINQGADYTKFAEIYPEEALFCQNVIENVGIKTVENVFNQNAKKLKNAGSKSPVRRRPFFKKGPV